MRYDIVWGKSSDMRAIARSPRHIGHASFVIAMTDHREEM